MNISEFFTKYEGKTSNTQTNAHLHKIRKNIWLGSAKARRNLQDYGITAVISIMTDFERDLFLETVNVKEFFIDLDDKPSASLFRAIYEIRSILTNNENEIFLVHCVVGRSRSPALLIGYLMLEEGLDYEEAYDEILKCRPSIHPNDGFKKQLNSCWIPSLDEDDE